MSGLRPHSEYIHVHDDHVEHAWAASNERVTARLAVGKGEGMRWNLRMKAAENGIWKSTELRRRLADAGLEISAGKMSALWTGTPVTVRLEDLDVICSVLSCEPGELLIREPDKVAARRPRQAAQAGDEREAGPVVTPRLGRNRTQPPA